MRLSRIKLAGFKSFVDPTTFHLPSNLVGIVGPNGCGKSNVIDAVRWVMGEMSAKHLRGDSMADVIFNGSASRKPVGSASIELVFDNSDGSIGGQFAQYSEISLRRTLSRDGTSSYFLNNTRCRRKDITDLFLGTGLGSRSYAIIEQGMVSRLVEAKPEEMRIYIEEAAGISKYKERRRETETRIQHTRDNLARLNDLREEISRQIDYLQRQARTAERYKELKSRERRLEAELLAMRLTELDRALEEGRLNLARRQTELEAVIADQRHIETTIVTARERHSNATEAFNLAQSQHYAVQSEISRIEQAIAHAREIRERRQADLTQARDQLATLEAEISRDRQRLEEFDDALAGLRPQIDEAREAEAMASASLLNAEHAVEQWQAGWHEFNINLKELQQTTQLEMARAEHIESQLIQLNRQRETVEAERVTINPDELQQRVAVQEKMERQAADRAQQLQARLDKLEGSINQLRCREREYGADLEVSAAELALRQGQLDTLQTVQEAALGSDDEVLGGWLSRENLANSPRLAQELGVEDRWVLAVETVMGDFLHAVCVDGFAHHLQEIPDTQFTLLDRGALPDHTDPRSLLARVETPGYGAQLLAGVMVAETIEDALRMQPDLQGEQSVITRDGIWLGSGWIRVNRGQRSVAGLLAREHQIRDLRVSIVVQKQHISEIDAQRSIVRDQLTEQTAERISLTAEFNSANRDHAESRAILDNQRQESIRAAERRLGLDREIFRLTGGISELSGSLEEARGRVQLAAVEAESLVARRPDLQQQQERLLAAYSKAREVADGHRLAMGRLNVDFESRRVSREAVLTSLGRVTAQQHQLSEKHAQLDQEIAAAMPAVAEMQADLAVHLDHQLTVDRNLTVRREELEQIETEIRASEGRRTVAEKTVAGARETVENLRMQVREVEVRRESLLESFAATNAVLNVVIQEMAPEATAAVWQENLDQARRKIERLGPINLAAIEQFNEQVERKKYLDAQNDDLAAALETLEQAMRRIDRETRSRFEETFESINHGLKRIFPRLFGGGHAYLSLEGEDILSAGVTVMARPPGKRNSHIHLLSGGEKALTAVALIFAIFELNPAPFCLLDEVDAPLDEANVARFCDIVNEMSQRVQFVVITHNKTTMEMTKQLTGVTMNEPGVSRLVSVDIDAAVKLVAS